MSQSEAGLRVTGKNKLTATRVREILHYRKNTGEMIWIVPPKVHPRMLGKKAGCKRSTRNGKFYIWIKVDGYAYSLSRLAFLWVTGRWPKEQIDHKNGNSLDNRWKNLREATQVQNSWNHKTRKRRIMLPMGIKACGSKFQARIIKNKVTHYLGVFHTLGPAVRAYKAKRKELFGEFA